MYAFYCIKFYALSSMNFIKIEVNLYKKKSLCLKIRVVLPECILQVSLQRKVNPNSRNIQISFYL